MFQGVKWRNGKVGAGLGCRQPDIDNLLVVCWSKISLRGRAILR